MGKLEESAAKLIAMAFEEDLDAGVDITSESLLNSTERGSAQVVARESGIVCGLWIVPQIVQKFMTDGEFTCFLSDGDCVQPKSSVLEISGSAIELLKVERTLLNFLGRLSGIATLTNRFVELTKDSKAKIFDTRKTTPGWRHLEKYAVKCGGGVNHRMGLHDAVLIKDNHLAMADSSEEGWLSRVKFAIEKIRSTQPQVTVQVEVDTLEQLTQILPLKPDIILLDNMTNDQLRNAVAMRSDQKVELEASGGVKLETVSEIAATGIERISVGALTHSAINFDFGMDWNQGGKEDS